MAGDVLDAVGAGGFGNPAYPLGMTMTNVAADSPDEITPTTSDANLTTVDPGKVVDCSKAYVDFPAIGASNYFGSTWDSRK